MASCDECIHEKLCVIKAFPEAFENTKWGKEPCDHFKPAADVVEVVRCKDCVSCRPLNRNDRFEALYSDGCVYCMINDEGMQPDDFCSRGERKPQKKRKPQKEV